MAELAGAGGCLTVDVLDIGTLSTGLERLAADEDLYRRLVDEATTRPLTTWDDYGRLIGNALSGLGSLSARPSAADISTTATSGAGERQRDLMLALFDGFESDVQRF